MLAIIRDATPATPTGSLVKDSLEVSSMNLWIFRGTVRYRCVASR